MKVKKLLVSVLILVVIVVLLALATRMWLKATGYDRYSRNEEQEKYQVTVPSTEDPETKSLVMTGFEQM